MANITSAAGLSDNVVDSRIYSNQRLDKMRKEIKMQSKKRVRIKF